MTMVSLTSGVPESDTCPPPFIFIQTSFLESTQDQATPIHENMAFCKKKKKKKKKKEREFLKDFRKLWAG